MPKVLGGYVRSPAGTDLSLQVVLGAARNMEEIRRLVLQNQLNFFFFSPMAVMVMWDQQIKTTVVRRNI